METSHNENGPNLHYLFLVLYFLTELRNDLQYQVATGSRRGSIVFEATLESTTGTNSIVLNKNMRKNRRVARLIVIMY